MQHLDPQGDSESSGTDWSPEPQAAGAFFRLRTRAGLLQFVGFALLGGLAVVSALTLEGVYSRAAGLFSIRAFLEQVPPGVLALNCVLMFCIGLTIYSITNNFGASALGLSAITALAAFANAEKRRLRGEPLYPADSAYLLEFDFLLESIGRTSAFGFFAAALLAIGLAAAWRFMRRVLPAAPGWNSSALSWAGWRSRIVCAVVSLSYLAIVAHFNIAGNPARHLYESAGAQWITWSQNENYTQNGFTAGWLFNLPGPAMQAPSGYSEAQAAEIVERYEQAAMALNVDRPGSVLQSMNVVIILSESLADPMAWEGISPEQDPIPFTRELMNEYTSGTMLSSGYGGGTANVEFEVYTGLSVRELQPQMRTPYQSILASRGSFPSLISSMASAGEKRADAAEMVGIHPFESAFYQRSRVYPALGFDRTHFIDDFHNEGRATYLEDDPYVSDAATFAWALDEIRASDEAIVLGLLTMQNHAPYWDKYADPIEVEEDFDGSPQVEQYLRGLSYSDSALQLFVTALEQLREPTVLLMYGDHLPSIFPAGTFTDSSAITQYTTPYVVWSNVTTVKADHSSIIGPNHLLTQVRETVGARLTTMDALLLKLREHVAAASPEFLIDTSGEVVNPDDLTEAAQSTLEEYRTIQYHLIEGSGDLADRIYAVPARSESPDADR